MHSKFNKLKILSKMPFCKCGKKYCTCKIVKRSKDLIMIIIIQKIWSSTKTASKYKINQKQECSEITENKECLMLFYITKNRCNILLAKSTSVTRIKAFSFTVYVYLL